MTPIKEIVKEVVSQITPTVPGENLSRSCCKCGKSIKLSPTSLFRFALDITCPECEEASELQRAEIANEEAMIRRERMIAAIPTAFRTTERERLPFPEKLDKALAWKFGARGLLLHGTTGCGKSRVAWEVAKRELLAGRSVKSVTAFELSRYPSLFMQGDDAAGRFADSLIAVDLLLLDDVFKAKTTERVEELLFGVLDERAAWEKPCIVTVNDTGDSLASRLSSDRGPALLRRLKEHCFSIVFS